MHPVEHRLRASRSRLSMATYRHRDRDMSHARLRTTARRLTREAARRNARSLLLSVRQRTEGTTR
ncbi:hypothetical protein AB0I72_19945 [Nocardiopsis sp. NPDC049922]|uniref:hypothetical protein n=1 Tax=Nocardiopsis sp. NPDC049922 TaxID=3155157 RepID=UPI0033FDC581